MRIASSSLRFFNSFRLPLLQKPLLFSSTASLLLSLSILPISTVTFIPPFSSIIHEATCLRTHPLHTTMKFSFALISLLVASVIAAPLAEPHAHAKSQRGGRRPLRGPPGTLRGGRGGRPRPPPPPPAAGNNQAPPPPPPPAANNNQPPAPAPAVNNNNGQNNNGGNGGNGFNAALVPDFGVQAGTNPDGTGNCAGINGKLIPCSCPPNRNDFVQKVQAAAAAGNSAGVPVSFPTDNSAGSQRARINTSLVVLQNFSGTKGVGCPAVSTTFLQQLSAIQG